MEPPPNEEEKQQENKGDEKSEEKMDEDSEPATDKQAEQEKQASPGEEGQIIDPDMDIDWLIDNRTLSNQWEKHCSHYISGLTLV